MDDMARECVRQKKEFGAAWQRAAPGSIANGARSLMKCLETSIKEADIRMFEAPLKYWLDCVLLMKPGGLLGFGDDSGHSRGIQLATDSDIGHLAIIEHISRNLGQVTLVEALGRGVVRTNLRHRLTEYEQSAGGRVYWLRLDGAFREAVDWVQAFGWLHAQIGKRYGPGQAIRSAFPTLCRWFGNKESFARLHCSELVAGMFKAGKAPGFECWNASEATPQDLVRADIYASAYRLGMGARLTRFSSSPPAEMANAVNTDR